MDIRGLNKASILVALYNRAKSQGMGLISYDPTPMTEENAQTILDSMQEKYFDYLWGRVMKIDLSGDEIDTLLYNRDNGPGAAEIAIAGLQPS